jgi:hypothetical protein
LSAAVALLGSVAPACLGPLVSDQIDPSTVFADPNAPVTHVESDPEYAKNVALFPGSIPRLQGWANGVRIHYWNVPGPNPDVIVPFYVLTSRTGQAVDPRPIIDALPGDAGYSPWWRKTLIYTTDKYAGQLIRSRDAIDLGVQLGILEPNGVATSSVVDCPVVLRDTPPLDLGGGLTKSATTVWYRNHKVHWMRFGDDNVITLDSHVRNMPKAPVYIFQRINQGAPLYEYKTGVDLNGDGILDDSNNVFADNFPVGASPLWYVSLVRTSSSYVSIDDGDHTHVDISSAQDIWDDTTMTITRPDLVKSVTESPTALVNCPLQYHEGQP